MYGEGGVYSFVSQREDYADVEKTQKVGMEAVNKAFGKEANDKMMADFLNCVVWTRSELRRRRMDLSRKAPTDMESTAKLIGESRVLRTTAVHVKVGRIAEFESLMKEAKEASERNPDTRPVLVSQVIEGGRGITFYFTTLRSGLGGFDKNPTAREVLGDEGFKKFQKEDAEDVENAESSILAFAPELSNPPDEIVKVAADFWQPKQTILAAAHKPKAPGAAGAEVKPAAEKPKP